MKKNICGVIRSEIASAMLLINMRKNIISPSNYLRESSQMKCWNGNFPTEQVWTEFVAVESVMRKLL